MTFKEILENPETTPDEQLALITALVSNIREKYGNLDVELPANDIITTEGVTPMSLLDSKSRLAVAEQELNRIVSIAYEDTQNAIGIVLDRRIEEYVSISPILHNLTVSTGSEYL